MARSNSGERIVLHRRVLDIPAKADVVHEAGRTWVGNRMIQSQCAASSLRKLARLLRRAVAAEGTVA